MKICLVGCGGISKCHFAAIESMKSSGARLVAVCDIVEKRAEKAAEKYGCVYYTSYDEMLKNESADVVHICTPHYLHVDMAVKALEKNISVVLEKPCATSFRELEQLEKAVESSEGQLAVCFQNRYNPSSVFAKKLIESGELGEICGGRAFVTWNRSREYYAADEWRGTKSMERGGVLINQAIHTHDMMMNLLNKTTYSVDGKIANFHLKDEIEVEDTACVYFKFTDGTSAVYYATTAAGVSAPTMIDIYFKENTLRIEGENVYIIDKDGEMKLLCSENGTSDGVVGKKEWGMGHRRLVSDFYDCVQKGRRFPVDVYQAGRAVRELLAAYESSEKNQTILL